MVIENNVKKANAWAYVGSLTRGLYGEQFREVCRQLTGSFNEKISCICHKDFLEMVWSRVDIVEHIRFCKGNHPYNLIGSFHVAQELPEGWIKHHFHFVDASGEEIRTESHSFTILKGSHIMKTDRLTLHRKLFELFKAVTGEEIMMRRLHVLQNYILSNNDADFGTEL